MGKSQGFDIEFTPGKAGKQPAQADSQGSEDGKRAVVYQRNGRGKFAGVFSTQSVERVGTGTTIRKTIQKTFWMVQELDSGEVEIQPLNANYIPSGPKRRVAREDILTKFQPEPEFYVQTVYPKLQELQETVVKGEAHRARGEMFSAEYEFENALEVDEENIRANFGLGLIYLERGEQERANNIFERLVKLDATFEEQHKHLYNEFGINLRKNKMYTQALEYYERARSLTGADENLAYNIARAWFENQNVEKAVAHLNNALKMNPKLEPALKFMDWLREQEFIPGEPSPSTALKEDNPVEDALQAMEGELESPSETERIFPPRPGEDASGGGE